MDSNDVIVEASDVGGTAIGNVVTGRPVNGVSLAWDDSPYSEQLGRLGLSFEVVESRQSVP